MNHFTYEQWKKYVKNEVDENTRKVYEDHLYSCDQCLETYRAAVEDCEAELPVLENEDIFTTLVMEEIKDSNYEEGRESAESEFEIDIAELNISHNQDVKNESFHAEAIHFAPSQEGLHKAEASKKKRAFYQKTAFHYVLAAAMTFILLSSGVFQKITEVTVSVSNPEIEEKTPSVTEGLLNKTFAWMDSLSLKNEEANE